MKTMENARGAGRRRRTLPRPLPGREGGEEADPPGEDDAAEIVRVLIVDLDADGFGDLVTANRLSRNISVMIDQLSITP